MTKHYSKENLTITWNPDVCIHAGECVRNCPEVFKPTERPWVQPENATAEKITAAINKCPSGALSINE